MVHKDSKVHVWHEESALQSFLHESSQSFEQHPCAIEYIPISHLFHIQQYIYANPSLPIIPPSQIDILNQFSITLLVLTVKSASTLGCFK